MEVVKSGIYWLTVKTTTVLPQFRVKPDCLAGHREALPQDHVLAPSLLSRCGLQSRYLHTESSVGLTVLRGIGLEDGLILIIPKCDWSSLLLEIISRIWG